MGAGEIGGWARGSESGSAPGAGPRSRGGVEHSGNLLVTPPPLPPTEKGRADAEAPGLGGGGGGEGGKEGGGGARARTRRDPACLGGARRPARRRAGCAPRTHAPPSPRSPWGSPWGPPHPPPPPPLPPRRSSQFVFTLGKAGVAVEGRRRRVGGGYSREAEAAAAAGSICCPSGRWRAKSS